MRKRALFAALCSLLWAPTAFEADGFVVEPYLQRATPRSIVIGWETRWGEHSSVEWGTTHQLGHRATAESLPSGAGHARTHRAELTGLAAGARYFYRVRTGSLVSSRTYAHRRRPRRRPLSG